MDGTYTLGSFGRSKLHALCKGLELNQKQTDSAIKMFDLACQSWSDWPLNATPYWPSDISDDHTPFEFSVEFGSEDVLLRILFESQIKPITSNSTWLAGLQFHERIKHLPGVDLTKFELIADLFKPKDKSFNFSLWHSAVLNSDGNYVFKAYLNPQIHGSESSAALIQEVLIRLNLINAWEFIASKLRASEGNLQLMFFSLDLVQGTHARVKIYLSNNTMSLQNYEFLFQDSRNYKPGEISKSIRVLTGLDSTIDSRPIGNYFAFNCGDQKKPACTIQVPIRNYVENDYAALQRTLTLLPNNHRKKLHAAMNNISTKTLELNRGLLAHVSIKYDAEKLGIVTYLSAEAYTHTYSIAQTPKELINAE